jgi:hypothetical protein
VTSHRFTIEGVASADLPLRVLNLFAQQDLPYERVAILRHEGLYVVQIHHAELTDEKAQIIVEKFRAMVLVESATLETLPGACDQPW